jgi:hypothetical protein
MAIDKKSLKEMFPNLYRELNGSENKVSIDAIRKNPQEAEEEVCGCDECEDFSVEKEEVTFCSEMPDKLRHFNPQAVDFIRRCDTEVQAEEIIAYLEKKGEISKDYAKELRCQLKRDGVRSFGSKKEADHYFREGGLY